MTFKIESLVGTLTEVDNVNKTVMNLTRRLNDLQLEIAATKKEIEKKKANTQ